ncbi:MAG TPA: hypothetical protein VJK66_02440 [Gaiellaceae bacterium]|nr:hypothetical protein [Gaiellaceae bacterium]
MALETLTVCSGPGWSISVVLDDTTREVKRVAWTNTSGLAITATLHRAAASRTVAVSGSGQVNVPAGYVLDEVADVGLAVLVRY